jgi:hypothetical protein
MTAKNIAEQIDVIRNATAKAVASREAAAAFLERAGIIEVQKVKKDSGSTASTSQHKIVPALTTRKFHKKPVRSGVAKQHAEKKAK